MLLESEKNTVLFSTHFAKDYKLLYESVISFLKKENIKHLTIPYTRDYWCRDFMPVQVNDKRFVQFVYAPDYLKDDQGAKYLTDVYQVMNSSLKNVLPKDAQIVHCPIVLDGGNMTVCRGRDVSREYTLLILMDKVFTENPTLTPLQIEQEIRTAIGEDVRFLWLPWEGMDVDKYGHTDGLVRFLNIEEDGRPSVLANLQPYGEHGDKLRKLLAEHCHVTEISLSQASDCNWAPMNFIQTDKAFVVPAIGEPQDHEMLQQLQSCLRTGTNSNYVNHINQIPIYDFVQKWGGALNCLSWTINI